MTGIAAISASLLESAAPAASGAAAAADAKVDANGIEVEAIPGETTGRMPPDEAIAKMETAVDVARLADWKRSHPAPFWLFGEERRLAVRLNVVPAHWFADAGGPADSFRGIAEPGEDFVFQVCVLSDRARTLAWESRVDGACGTPIRITPERERVKGSRYEHSRLGTRFTQPEDDPAAFVTFKL